MKFKFSNLILIYLLVTLSKVFCSMECRVERFTKKLLENEISVKYHNSDFQRNGKTFPLFNCEPIADPRNQLNVIKCQIKTTPQIKCNDFILFYFPELSLTDNEKQKYSEKCQCNETKNASLFISDLSTDSVVKEEDKKEDIINLNVKRNKKDSHDTQLTFNYVFNNDKECVLSLKANRVQYTDCVNIIKYLKDIL